jgi:hypothetical protein
VHPLLHRKALLWRPPPSHRCFDSASVHPRRGRGLHGATFDKMSFKFGATWGERYFAGLVWTGNPSFLPQHRRSLISSHFLQSSPSIIVKASKESQSDKVACHEVATFRTEALDGDDRSAQGALEVVLFICLGLCTPLWRSLS